MSPRRLVNSALVLALLGTASPLACGAASKPAAPVVAEPTPAPAPPSSASPAGSIAASAAASSASAPVTAAPEATAAPPSSSEPAPPCVDGEVLMGTCICTDNGKTPDATGHCAYPPCPKSTSGGTAFRDEETGQCFECRAGTRPTKDGRCER